MDYEKKYKEALERARELATDLPNGRNDRLYHVWDLESIFPELKESEDEKVRKEIIALVKSQKEQQWHRDGAIYDRMIAWLEKQGGQNPADKVEPKFKVGDWVVLYPSEIEANRKVVQISRVERCQLNMYWTTEGTWFGDGTDARLWTIQDAKGGDVLVDTLGENNIIILYKGINPKLSVLAYCGWNGYNLSIKTNGLGYGNLDNTNYSPATKEQRDLLFSKMKEEGYEWDADNKELKKI